MPRTTRSGPSTAAGRQRNGVPDGGGAMKRKAVDAAAGKAAPNAKRRAALGEITNAFVETKSQAKKGLSRIIGKSKAAAAPAANKKQVGGRNSGPEGSRRRSSRGKQGEEDEDLDLSGRTRSLPSSQESLFKDVQAPDDVDTEADDEHSDESENYESAEEGAGGDGRKKGDPSRVLPPNVVDFDALNVEDPNQVSEYVMETFQYYKDREAQFRCPDYLHTAQRELSTAMRSILVDWLVEVQESFELNHETLYTAVKIMDLFLSRAPSVRKEELQLVGATACLIACKIDERIPPLLDDFVYVCDDAYSKDDIKAKEREMIAMVDFDVGYPLTYRFLRRYGRVCQVSMPVLTLGRYILEMALMEYHLNVETSESLLAAAALVLTFHLKEIVDGWQTTLKYYSGYAVEDCLTLVHKLHKMLLKPQNEMRRTIKTKYEHEVFHQVAKIHIPQEIDL